MSGSAITTLTNCATDTSSTTTITWTATGLPSGLVDQLARPGTITGTPTTAGIFSVTVTATDAAGYAGSTTFNWTITNTVTVTNPGSKSNVSGPAIIHADRSATDTQRRSTLTWTADRSPGRPVHQPVHRHNPGLPDHGLSCSVTLTATDNSPATRRSATFTWTITNTVTVSSPGHQSILPARHHGRHHRSTDSSDRPP